MTLNPSVKNKEKDAKAKRARQLYTEGDLLVQHHEYYKASQKFTEAISLRPAFARYFNARANCYRNLGEYKRAIFDYTMAIQMDDSTAAGTMGESLKHIVGRYYSNRGTCFRHIGKLDDAIGDFTRALQLADNGKWHCQMGLTYYDAGDKNEAIRCYTRAINSMSETFSTYKPRLYRGNTYRELGLYEAAIDDLLKAVDADPSSAHAQNLLGLALFESRDLPAGINAFTKAIELDSSKAVHYNNRGLAYFRSGKYEDALLDFDDALLRDDDNANIFFNRGNTHLAAKNYEAALQDFDDARGRIPDDEGVYYSKGIVYLELGQIADAVQQFQMSRAANPAYIPALFHLGLCQHKEGKLFEAQALFSEVVKLDDTDRRAHESLGLVYCDLHLYDLAQQSFEKALALQPNHPINLYYKGKALLWQGLYEQAKETFERSLEYGAVDPLVKSDLSMARKYLGDHAGAIADLTAAIEADPNCVEFLFNRAQCHCDVEHFDRAAKDLSAAIEMDSSEAKLFGLRGHSYFKQGMHDHCIQDMLTAIALDPSASGVDAHHYLMGLAQSSCNRHEEAIRCFQEAVSLSPNTPTYLHELAKSLQCAGRHRDAIVGFGKVLALQPLNAHAYFRRGFSHKAVSEFDAAAADFEVAKKIAPHNSRLIVDYRSVRDVEFIILCPPVRGDRLTVDVSSSVLG